jgi:putative membrane protein insertion efficiency factor
MSARKPSPLQVVMVKAIDGYQFVRRGRPSPCRYVPSCSDYAKEAVQVHGGLRGAWLAVRRVARCNPFGSSGFDPVPSPRQRSIHGRKIAQ